MKSIFASALLLLASALVFRIPAGSAADLAEPNPVRIGMVQTLFHDVPTPIVNLLLPPFKGLLKQFTGLNGDVVPGGNPFEVARLIAEDRIHLAVFHGVEFAWAQQKYPDLRPLMIAINKHRTLRAHLVVAGDGPIADVAELKGKTLAVPMRTKEHCRLFLEKTCSGCARCDSQAFFSQILRPANVEMALDEVLAGKLGAAVVDAVAWENYAEVKPGCYRRLRVLKTSEVFPSAVVAYREGSLNETTLTKFRSGMQNANKNERGRDLMTLWKISAFEPVPADYTQTLSEILQAYPPPVLVTPVSRMP